jgi:hypothetical protein
MNPPLKVDIRPDATINDSSDGRMIVVLNTKPNQNAHPKLDFCGADRRERAQNDIQHQEYVFVPEAAEENSAARRTLIRSHVMRNCTRRKEEQARVCNDRRAERRLTTFRVSSKVSSNQIWTYSPQRQPSGILDPFAKYPIQMQPRAYRLVQHCRYPHSSLVPVYPY